METYFLLSRADKLIAQRWLLVAVHESAFAQSGQSSRTRECPPSDKSRQQWIFARDGLSAFDPKADTRPVVI